MFTMTFPWSALKSLDNDGYIMVWRRHGQERPLLARDAGHRGSFMLGRAESIPASSLSPWHMELRAVGLNSRDVAKTLLDWGTFTRLTLDQNIALAPGMTLEAEVRTQADKVKARAVVTLGNEEFIDVPMMAVGDESND